MAKEAVPWQLSVTMLGSTCSSPLVPLEALAFALTFSRNLLPASLVVCPVCFPSHSFGSCFLCGHPQKVQGSKRAWSVSLLLLGIQVPQK